jgi:hypothetical protein
MGVLGVSSCSAWAAEAFQFYKSSYVYGNCGGGGRGSYRRDQSSTDIMDESHLFVLGGNSSG